MIRDGIRFFGFHSASFHGDPAMSHLFEFLKDVVMNDVIGNCIGEHFPLQRELWVGAFEKNWLHLFLEGHYLSFARNKRASQTYRGGALFKEIKILRQKTSLDLLGAMWTSASYFGTAHLQCGAIFLMFRCWLLWMHENCLILYPGPSTVCLA